LAEVNSFLENIYWKSPKYIYFIAGLILAIFIIYRPLNHDETYYLASSKIMFQEGKLPYKDFIFHQMPAILFIYMPVALLDIWGLIIGRLISSILLFFSFLIFLKTFKKDFQNKYIIFLILFWLNLFLIDWAVTVKIYSLSVFLFSCGIFYYMKYLDNPNEWKYLLFSSMFFSVLVLTKVVFLANYFVLVFYTLYLFYSDRSKQKLINIIIVTVLPLSICIFLFALLCGTSLDRLYFNLFEINLIYKNLSPFWQDFQVFCLFFAIPQNFLLVLTALFSLNKTNRISVFLLFNIVIFLLAHFPSRLLMEYNTTILPLIIILAVLGYDNFVTKLSQIFRIKSQLKLAIILLVLYILVSPLSIYHIKQKITRDHLPLNPLELFDFNQKINALNGKTILSSWEGLSVFSSKETLFKDNYAITFVNEYIDSTTKDKYNLITNEDYKKLIYQSKPDIIIFDNSNAAHLSELDDIIRVGYNITFTYNDIDVFERK